MYDSPSPAPSPEYRPRSRETEPDSPEYMAVSPSNSESTVEYEGTPAPPAPPAPMGVIEVITLSPGPSTPESNEEVLPVEEQLPPLGVRGHMEQPSPALVPAEELLAPTPGWARREGDSAHSDKDSALDTTCHNNLLEWAPPAPPEQEWVPPAPAGQEWAPLAPSGQGCNTYTSTLPSMQNAIPVMQSSLPAHSLPSHSAPLPLSTPPLSLDTTPSLSRELESLFTPLVRKEVSTQTKEGCCCEQLSEWYRAQLDLAWKLVYNLQELK